MLQILSILNFLCRFKHLHIYLSEFQTNLLDKLRVSIFVSNDQLILKVELKLGHLSLPNKHDFRCQLSVLPP